MGRTLGWMAAALVALALVGDLHPARAAGPTPADWAALGRLPDWSGVWVPDMQDQEKQITSNPTPWNAKAGKQAERLAAEEGAGRPKGLFINCLPEAMPSWMLISHNAMEVLFTPGRVTLLGESDGNRLRRIYTDGRSHPQDPDLTFFGHSVGHWEGDALVVDTVGVLPQAYVAISEAIGIPNDGDMHIRERVHLAGADTLADELEITAPHVLSRPWRTTRLFHRMRGPENDIEEGVCLQGGFAQKRDENGDDVFVPLPHDTGIPVAPGQ
ncbi:MAG TPA: hypothetical protein VIJ94_08620 [Caulobacteraceae bacterium]